MDEKGKQLTPFYGRLLIRLTRPFPDFDFRFIKPVRRRAVELLSLKSGDSVLDVGCGPGGSLPFLVEAVGPLGRVVAVEISPEHAELARRRIAKNEWKNAEVIVSSAQEVKLAGTFDGLVMFAAPDVYASPEALDNLIPHLNDRARIVAFGAKLSTRPLGRLFNRVIKLLIRLSFSTTPKPELEPLRILSNYVEDLVIDEYFFGLMFLASATLSNKK